ncbi:TRAP transporter substrate-binding protein [Ammoniphilus resinae]|uniref:Tripartite ATP-independent transporter DctP family solute receptor n=1 Tax=Ammoniphilus resinae TaxID=861532 RepID=A0ABS4GSX7_9BACL|nr:TRAP transporter substrate-binding protein [Ammoniphilus resinae]MBP1933368.1 tripartite ATP-independent transporter DctP family solute receptor [Ammoniphilus resinae]
MKKGISLALVGLLAAGSLVGCGSKPAEQSSTGGSSQPAPSNNSSGGEKSGGSSSIEEVTIAVAHATPDSETSHYHAFATKFKELVEKNTDGKVKIEIHPNGELGGEREAVEAVQIGTLDATITSSGPVGNFAPLSNAFDFPFLFRDKAHAYKVLDGELGAEVSKQLESVGIVNLAWAENGFRNITNNKRPIKKPEDLQGLKIRTMENKVHLDSFKEFGAAPTPMAITEVFTSMQQGVVDGEENPLSVIVPQKFYEVQKYMTLSGHFYSPALFVINKSKFDGFSPELQKILIDAATASRDYEREFIANLEDKYIQTAKDSGMEILTASEYDQAAFQKASEPIYKKYEAEYGEFIQKILDTK